MRVVWSDYKKDKRVVVSSAGSREILSVVSLVVKLAGLTVEVLVVS